MNPRLGLIVGLTSGAMVVFFEDIVSILANVK